MTNNLKLPAQIDLKELLRPGMRAHLIGIGGIGMSGLAKVLKYFGLEVSGSDMKSSAATQELEEQGIRVAIEHSAESVKNIDFVVYSSAIQEKNEERLEADEQGIPTFRRAEILSALMNQGVSIGITGTHGKTTTSAWISFILTQAGYHPTCLIGGKILHYNSNVLLGDKHFFVSEVDESDRTHLLYRPDFAVLTNLEEDHLDTYADMNDLRASFASFVEHMRVAGCILFNGHDENLKKIVQGAPNAISFGLSKTFQFGADEIVHAGFGSEFRLYENGKAIDTVRLAIPGKHNVMNAVAVIATLRKFGLAYEQLLPLMVQFRGTARRLEVKCDVDGLMIIDDYAHHPTEVKASIAAIRSLQKPMTVVFQPHRYSRTAQLGQTFAHAFDQADRIVLTDIYAAGEENVHGLDGQFLYQIVKNAGHSNVCYIPKSQILQFLSDEPIANSVIAFLGAGDIGELASEFSKRFKSEDLH